MLKRSEERLRLLASASELLASSLDESATLRAVADLVVPMLADVALIDVLGSDGLTRRYQTGVYTRPPAPLDVRAPQAEVLSLGRADPGERMQAAALHMALGDAAKTRVGRARRGRARSRRARGDCFSDRCCWCRSAVAVVRSAC